MDTQQKVNQPGQLTLQIPGGLLGLEHLKEYVMEIVPGKPFFRYLQAREEEIAFLLLQPRSVFPDYQVQLDPEQVGELQGCSRESLSVYTIITLADCWEKATANLLAPLIVNEEAGLGKQVVLEDTSYKTRHYIFSPDSKTRCG